MKKSFGGLGEGLLGFVCTVFYACIVSAMALSPAQTKSMKEPATFFRHDQSPLPFNPGLAPVRDRNHYRAKSCFASAVRRAFGRYRPALCRPRARLRAEGVSQQDCACHEQ